jgi:hypothetical protein
MAIKDLNKIYYLGVSTDAGSHGLLKLLSLTIKYFHKFHDSISKLVYLNSTINKKLEIRANCVSQTLKEQGRLTKCAAFYGET